MRMDFARIGSGQRMNRVDLGNRMDPLPPLAGGSRAMGTCWLDGMRYRSMADTLIIDDR